MGDITGANALIIISWPLLLPVPVQLAGFATDDVFDTEEVNSGETMMGVDGILSAGMVFEKTPTVFTFQADSPTIPTFETVDAAQQSNTAMYQAQGNVTLTAVGRSYQLVNGYLVKLPRLPNVKRLLQPRKFRMEWQSIIPIPVGTAG